MWKIFGNEKNFCNYAEISPLVPSLLRLLRAHKRLFQNFVVRASAGRLLSFLPHRARKIFEIISKASRNFFLRLVDVIFNMS